MPQKSKVETCRMEREAFDKKYTQQLNRQQSEAVHAVEGAVLLLAVPGSGKTTVLVTRLGYMLCCCGIHADEVLSLTYTRAAAGDMKRRFAALFGRDCPQVPQFRTINGISSKIIDFYVQTHGRKSAFKLMEEDGELSKLVSELYRRLSGEFAVPSVIRNLRSQITYVKNNMLSEDEIDVLDADFEHFPELYKQYNLALRNRQWMDYDDQMVYAKNILEKFPNVLEHFQNTFRFICVDEAQDTSKIQHKIIHLLARKNGNIFMVGDEDQSIYGFRAAYPEALLRFEQTYPAARVLLMEENYRSTPEILRPANGFVQKNLDRHPKTIRPTRRSGENVHMIHAANRAAQYAWLIHAAENCSGRTAILYRNNDCALPLIDLFDRHGKTYQFRQMNDLFFTSRLITDILDIIAFARDGRNAEIFMRIYYKFGGGLKKEAAEFACNESKASGKPILEELLRFPTLSSGARNTVMDLIVNLLKISEDTAQRGLERIWYDLRYKKYATEKTLDAGRFEILCLLAENEPNTDSLVARLEYLHGLVTKPCEKPNADFILSTIHSAKGLEYDTAFITDVFDGILPSVTEPKDEAEMNLYQEDRRLFYVAMTRAKNALFLFGSLDYASAFVKEVQHYIPIEVTAEDDVFYALPTELCGKHYTHSKNGSGTILAECEGKCLIAFENGETQLMSVGRMYEQRLIVRKLPEKPAAPKDRFAPNSTEHGGKTNAAKLTLSPEEKAALIRKAAQGGRVTHSIFGAGKIVDYQSPIVTVQFVDSDEKKFLLLNAVEQGLLRFE